MIGRHAAKRAAERALRLLVGNPARSAGQSLILAYHNVIPDHLPAQGDRSLHLPLSSFARQLDLLVAHCRVLPLAELLAGGPGTDGPRIAITFDDAYRGATELAMPELARRGLPSTLFVAPDLLGRRSLWWDELAVGDTGLSPALRAEALDAAEGLHDEVRRRFPRPGQPASLPEWYGCADESAVVGLWRSGGVTLGAHSWSHPNLTRVAAETLADELRRPLEWLRASNAPMLPVLAYPYGLCTPRVEQAARQAGYTAALLVDGGWLGPAVDPFRVPRYNVPAGLSEDGFMLRLSGILGVSSSANAR
jgi:peptidoglycan/xylan/chitin deacetylase (PgdA/CDA1 family)